MTNTKAGQQNRRVDAILRDLHELGQAGIAHQSQRFFKTGPGEYGAGDLFLGIRVPVIRASVKKQSNLALPDIVDLLQAPYHEARMMALLIMVTQARAGRDDAALCRALYETYLEHTDCINNWDLVDCSAEHIVGVYLYKRSRRPLHVLARSASLWERPIAIIATYHFIKQGDLAETFALAEALLHDSHDLIHKATGWMLREASQREPKALCAFIDRHGRAMPRTMLRYAIEKMNEDQRQGYLKGTR